MTGFIWWDILIILGVVNTSIILIVLTVRLVSRASWRKYNQQLEIMSHLADELHRRDRNE